MIFFQALVNKFNNLVYEIKRPRKRVFKDPYKTKFDILVDRGSREVNEFGQVRYSATFFKFKRCKVPKEGDLIIKTFTQGSAYLQVIKVSKSFSVFKLTLEPFCYVAEMDSTYKLEDIYG